MSGRLVSVADSSFEGFYEREYPAVLAFSRSLSPTRQHAEDIVHDAFEAALSKWHSIDNPSSWIRQVVSNKTKSLLRRRYAEQRAMRRLSRPVTIGADLPEDTDAFWGRCVVSLIGNGWLLRCSIWRIARLLRSQGCWGVLRQRQGFIYCGDGALWR